jgi:hypothetical protein
LSKTISCEKRASRRRKAAFERLVPGELDVRDPPWDEDEVDGPVADHLIGDVNVAALGVPGVRDHRA